MTLNIKDFLGNSSLEVNYSGETTDHDAIVSSIILFAAVAKADGELEPKEINAVLGIVVREFDIKEAEAANYMEVALLLSDDKTKLDKFISNVENTFSREQKQLIMALIWRVMLSDQIVEKSEAVLAVRIRTALGLTMEEAVRCRKLAELDVVSVEILKGQVSDE